jgi:hypothetical protein
MGIRSLLRKVFGRDRAERNESAATPSVPPQTERAVPSATVPSPTPASPAEQAAADLVAAAFDAPRPRRATVPAARDASAQDPAQPATTAPEKPTEPPAAGEEAPQADAVAAAEEAPQADAVAAAEEAPQAEAAAAAEEPEPVEAPQAEAPAPAEEPEPEKPTAAETPAAAEEPQAEAPATAEEAPQAEAAAITDEPAAAEAPPAEAPDTEAPADAEPTTAEVEAPAEAPKAEEPAEGEPAAEAPAEAEAAPAPAEEPTATEEQAPAEEQVTAEEAPRTEEPAEAEETAQAQAPAAAEAESAPAEEQGTTEKQTAEEQVSAEEPTATEEPAPAEEAVPAEEPAPAGDAPQGKPAHSLARVKARAPQGGVVVEAYKAAGAVLKKRGLTGARAAVYLVLDRSGSMRPYYKDGSAQHLAEQALALAAHLDGSETPTVPVVFFSTEIDGTGEVTLDDVEGRIEALHSSLGRMGRTNYDRAINEVLDLHEKSGAPDRPALVVFQTDGAPESKTAATQALADAAARNGRIQWQFVAFGEEDSKAFDYLRKLQAENAGFFHAGPAPRDVPHATFFRALLADWSV